MAYGPDYTQEVDRDAHALAQRADSRLPRLEGGAKLNGGTDPIQQSFVNKRLNTLSACKTGQALRPASHAHTECAKHTALTQDPFLVTRTCGTATTPPREGRGMALTRNKDHQFEAGEPPFPDWQECVRCGMPLPPGSEPYSACSGMNQRHKLSRTGSLDRSSPLSPVSDSNSGREHQKDEAFRTFVREQPCVACGDPPPSDPAHYRSWGSGHGDKRNLFAACRGCHTEQHAIGIESWQEKHDLDLDAETDRIWREYKQFRRAKA